MTEQREELLTDPATKLILLKSGDERDIHVKKLAEMCGIDPYRVKERAKELDKHRFVTFQKGLYIDVKEENVDSLKRFRKSIEHFANSNSSQLLKNNLEASKRIKQRLNELEEQKSETDSVKKEKDLDKQINHIKEALERENSFESPQDVLSTSARISRIDRVFCGSDNLHGCNVERKAKCLSTIKNLFQARIR